MVYSFARDWRALPNPGTQLDSSSNLHSSVLSIIQVCGEDLASFKGISCGDSAEKLFESYGFTDASAKEMSENGYCGNGAWATIGMYFPVDPSINSNDIAIEPYTQACFISRVPEVPDGTGRCLFFLLTENTVSGMIAFEAVPLASRTDLAITTHEPIDFYQSTVIPTDAPVAAVACSNFENYYENYSEEQRSEYQSMS